MDIYWAGHIHFYETFDGPIYNSTVVGGKQPEGGMHNPEAVIHVCTGNGENLLLAACCVLLAAGCLLTCWVAICRWPPFAVKMPGGRADGQELHR